LITEGSPAITPKGCQALERIVAARRAHLTELFAKWTPRDEEELVAALRRAASDMVPDARSSGAHRAIPG
jgi:hypothetical protein